MKVCRNCTTSKDETEYYANDKVCKACRCENARQNRIKNPKPPKPKTPRMDGFRLLPDDVRKCGSCQEVKHTDNFSKDKHRSSGYSVYCKPCAVAKHQERRVRLGEKALETRRKWAEDNREKLREQDKTYRESNRDKMRVTENKRRARKALLPDTLTEKETADILSHFNNKCALCDKPAEALDHFIPLASGFGGTTKENIIPLCKTMNSSKLARNPFIWADTTLTKSEQKRFKSLIEYLSSINGLTVEEYREFVFSCFKTKNKNIS